MTLDTRIEVQGFTLTAVEQRRINRHLAVLEHQALAHRPAPKAVLVLRQHVAQRLIDANLQVQLGPLGAHVVSHQAAETADRAVRLAVTDIERQLERRLASQRGEPSYGVPSRREPAALRPHPLRQPAPAVNETVPETTDAPGADEGIAADQE